MTEEIKPMTTYEIFKNLKRDDKDNVRQTISNYVYVLNHDPVLRGNVRYNIMTERDCILGDVGWSRGGDALTDTDISYLKLYFERNYALGGGDRMLDAIRIVANEKQFHPVREYLESLKWDGQERIREVLPKYLGAEDCPLNYEFLKVFLMGAISRVFKPGVKFELMLCLVGGQGAGKSSFFRLLAVRDEWFSDDLKKIDDENVYRKLQGHWIIEMSEMIATANAKSIEEVRGFISRTKETYKIPYDKFPADHSRQCVFGGTSNSLDFLPLDRAGNRRFLPILVNPEKVETHILENEQEARAYIDQLWAEAMTIYRSGKFRLSLSKEMEKEARKRQLEFMPEDTTTGRIQSYLDNLKTDVTCTLQIIEEGLGRLNEPTQREIREVNDIMNNSIDGWEPGKHKRLPGYGTQRTWRRKTEIEALDDFPVIDSQEELPGDW